MAPVVLRTRLTKSPRLPSPLFPNAQVRILPKIRMAAESFANKDGVWALQNVHTKERTAQVGAGQGFSQLARVAQAARDVGCGLVPLLTMSPVEPDQQQVPLTVRDVKKLMVTNAMHHFRHACAWRTSVMVFQQLYT